MEGWISLHKKMMNWEWYKDQNTKDVFIHCLLKANYEDKTLDRKLIKRGQFMTSLQSLSEELGLTKSQIRTALKRLTRTHEIAQTSTHKYSLINVEKYEDYQCQYFAHTQQNTHEIATTNKDIDIYNYVCNTENMEEEKYDRGWLEEVLKKCANLASIKRLRGEINDT